MNWAPNWACKFTRFVLIISFGWAKKALVFYVIQFNVNQSIELEIEYNENFVQLSMEQNPGSKI